MTGEFDIWDSQNRIVLEAYQKDNYQCIDTGVESNICYIFFSSNGLYYPNTKIIFEEQIFLKDRYEWKWVVKNSKIPQIASRIIYVRDIYKCWYSRGINNRINTIEKTLELLKELTKGYRIVTVGSSAGGYMAVLTAIKLDALFCINFSGQYAVSEELDIPYKNISGLLEAYKGTIFYFVPAYCENDEKQYRLVEKKECIKIFFFNEKRHAATMLPGNMSYIIDKSEADLLKLYESYVSQKINKFFFLFNTVPFHKAVKILCVEVKGFLIRRTGKHYNGM